MAENVPNSTGHDFEASSSIAAEKKSDKDKKEKEEDSRGRRAHLRLVPSESEGSGRESTASRNAESEKGRQSEPTNIIELFKAKSPDMTEADEPATEEERDIGITPSVLAEARLQAMPEQAGKAEAADARGDAAARDYLERVADGEDIETAAAKLYDTIGATPEEVAAVEAAVLAERPPAEEIFAAEEAGDVLTEREFDREPAAPGDNEDDQNEAEPKASATGSDSAATASGGMSSAFGGTAGGQAGPGGPGNLSPPPGSPPLGPNSPLGNPGNPGNFPNPNIMYSAPVLSGNLNTPPSHEIYDSGNPAVAALIGYLIGRRRGRRRGIKIERKARIKSERKLKRQIEDIDWKLKAREEQIRRLATGKARLERDMLVMPRPHKEAPPKAEKLVEKPHSVNRLSEQRAPARAAAPEAYYLHGQQRKREHLGQVLVNAAELPLAAAASWRPESTPESVKPEPAHQNRYEDLPRHLTERRVETLNRNELLIMSERIVIDGSNLRQIYETHLIGERGLRRLVAEHLRGGDVKKILRQEILEHEIDFERDPAVRDLPAPADKIGAVSAPSPLAGKAALDKMVRQASANLGSNTQLAYYKARAAYEAREQKEENSHRRIVDVGLVTVILGLTAAVVILLLTGH